MHPTVSAHVPVTCPSHCTQFYLLDIAIVTGFCESKRTGPVLTGAFPGSSIPRWAPLGSYVDQPSLLLTAQPEVLNGTGEVASLVMVLAFDCSCPTAGLHIWSHPQMSTSKKYSISETLVWESWGGGGGTVGDF